MTSSEGKRSVFVDTSAIVALMSARENSHEDTAKIFQHLKEKKYRLVISNYIVDEAYACVLNTSKFRDPLHKIQLAFRLLGKLHDENDFAILFVNEPLEEEARTKLLMFKDKLWSITDMTSFLLINHGDIEYCLSYDSDFDQAGPHFGFKDIRPYL